MWIKRTVFIWLYAAVCICVSLQLFAQGDSAMPVKNMRLPLEFYDNGVIKTQLKAGYALVPPEGMIIATNVIMEMFFEDGSTNVIITAHDCKYDRKKQFAGSDNKIKIVHEDIVITGKGYEWFADKERVKILSEAKIIFNREGSLSGSDILKGLKKENKKDE